MLAKLLAEEISAPAKLDAGAPMQPAMDEINSSLDGRAATALTPATSKTVSPIAPPSIVSLSFSLEKSYAAFAAATGSSE